MVWTQSKNNEKNRDPWEKYNSNDSNVNRNNGKINQEPPDISQIFRKIGKKFYGIKNNSYYKNNKYFTNKSMRFLIIFLAATIAVWVATGFYTVKETERGVITRFGKFSHLVRPGLNWKPTFIDQVQPVNIETVRELAASGVMLTSDENVVSVEMNVQYRVTNPERYLFSVINADDSLRQATDSALRGVIGRSTMDRILTEGRTLVRSDTQRELEDTIRPYDMGLTLLDVNFQAARPPEEVKAAFDDAIAARENREQYVREAEAYANEVQPKANGRAQRILEEARAYKSRIVLEAQGEVARFIKLLPQYHLSPDLTKKRLYIETMESVLKKTKKILISDHSNKVILLPIENSINHKSNIFNRNQKSKEKTNFHINKEQNDFLNTNKRAEIKNSNTENHDD